MECGEVVTVCEWIFIGKRRRKPAFSVGENNDIDNIFKQVSDVYSPFESFRTTQVPSPGK